MQEIQVTTTVTVKENGKIKSEITKHVGVEDKKETENSAVAAGQPMAEISKENVERYAVATDLANVCEYLEDSEIIKIKLIINKAEKRKRSVEDEA